MTSVRNRQIKLARRLRHELGGDFVVVAAPDHPLVMRSVDILVGGRSSLTAFMMSSAEERRQPALLQARFTLNQVALPPEAQFIYVADEDEASPPIHGRFIAQLNVADRSIINDAVALVERSVSLPQVSSADKARQLSQRRFASTYRVARLINAKRFRRDDDFYLAPAGAKLSFDTIMSVPSAFSHRSISTRSLIGLSVRGVDRWFEPSDDQPRPTGGSAGLVFSPDFPRLSHDPEKALRAAAFAGWVLAPRSSSRTPEEIAELVLRFTRLQ
jgi:hypothetical protein